MFLAGRMGDRSLFRPGPAGVLEDAKHPQMKL